jgi:hypothetical protein
MDDGASVDARVVRSVDAEGSAVRDACGGRAEELEAPAAERDASGDAECVCGDAAGVGDEVDAMQTSVSVSDGGRACVVPASPEPHTHPSRSPSATVDDAAPVEDHVQPPWPSPRQ